jgi:hypothetical protein
MNRRAAIRIGLGTAAALAIDRHAPVFAQTPRRRLAHGCMLSRLEAPSYLKIAGETRLYETGREPMISSSGDKDFDMALAQTLSKISDAFAVLPGFAYYDDHDDENAYATEAVRLTNADGTVLFGQRLLKRLLALRENPDIAVAAVCAHEFGHILQYKQKLVDRVSKGQTSVKRTELQADFFAGYFAGLRKRERPEFPAAVFALTQYNSGDDMLNDPDHHGTPDERGAAISRGYEAAYRERLSLGDAIEASVAYVTRL